MYILFYLFYFLLSCLYMSICFCYAISQSRNISILLSLSSAFFLSVYLPVSRTSSPFTPRHIPSLSRGRSRPLARYASPWRHRSSFTALPFTLNSSPYPLTCFSSPSTSSYLLSVLAPLCYPSLCLSISYIMSLFPCLLLLPYYLMLISK